MKEIGNLVEKDLIILTKHSRFVFVDRSGPEKVITYPVVDIPRLVPKIPDCYHVDSNYPI